MKIKNKVIILILAAALAAALCACGSSQPQSGAGSAADGSTANGSAADGSTAGGSTANGSTADGSTADGSTASSDVTASAEGESAITADADDGSADTDAVKASFDKASAYIESIFDTKNMTKQTEDGEPGFFSCAWLYDKATYNADLSSDVEVDGSVITIGKTTVKELDDMGFDKVDKFSDTVQSSESVSVNVENGMKSFMLKVDNDSDEPKPIDDLVIAGFSAANFADVNLPFNYSGLKADSSFEEAAKIFGKPNFSIVLSADEVSTSITLAYSDNKKENGVNVSDILEIFYKYDAESNTAHYAGIDRSRNIEPLEE